MTMLTTLSGDTQVALATLAPWALLALVALIAQRREHKKAAAGRGPMRGKLITEDGEEMQIEIRPLSR